MRGTNEGKVIELVSSHKNCNEKPGVNLDVYLRLYRVPALDKAIGIVISDY
jgi:hypothetical protein